MEPKVNRDAKRFIPVAKPSIGFHEFEAVQQCLISGQISSGPRVREFEREFAEAHGKKFGVACNSGTTALQLALMVAGVEDPASDYVVCPAMTMVACPNAILSAGGRPEFIDSEPDTGNMRLDDIEDLSYFPHAIIYVHLYGVPVEFKSTENVTTIEDCAECHYGCFEDGSPVGSRGDLACFSFFANKIITTGGEGGIVLTNDADVAERLRGLRAHAFTPGEHFHHKEHALGCRMTDIQAAFGLAQHRRRHEFISRREEIFERYSFALRSLDWVQQQQRTIVAAKWVFPLLVRDGFGRIDRNFVRNQLAASGIETRTWFKPMNEQPRLRRFASGAYPVAADLYRRGLYLPLFPDMSDDDVSYVIDQLVSFRP